MADDTAVQVAGVTPVAPAPDGQGGGSTEPETPPTGGAPTTGLTQAQVDAIVTRRLAQAAKKSDDEKAALQAELDGYKTAEQKKADAEKTELQKAQEALAAKDAEAATARTQAEAEKLARIRAELIANDEKAARLPIDFKNSIIGDTPEKLAESAVAAVARYEELVANLAPGAPPVPSIGGSGKAGGTQAAPPKTWADGNRSVEAWRVERERLGVGKIAL